MSDDILIVQPITPNITVEPIIPVVNITSPGPQGPPGVFNPANIFYVHTQNSPSNVWTINHNLNGHPTAVVKDSSGNQYEGLFTYPTLNQMVITFSAQFSGTAYII